jgi:alpha-L-fucosidase
MKKINHIIIVLTLGLILGQTASGAAEELAETEAEYQERMQWFTDAKFGLFIHYGVYSTLGGEWKGEDVKKYAEWIQCHGNITPEEYIPLAANFSPDELDADAWVKRAKDAGMKYMVITTKHHEGFCLWDSAYTEYDLGEATPFDRDILGELAAACKKYGIKFGTYYSIIDWHHSSQRAKKSINQTPMNDKEGYVIYMKAQLKELIDRYDPAIMWFDGDWTKWWTMEDGIDLYNYLRTLSPDMIINNRVAKRAKFKKDFGTPENATPGAALDHIWEACWTVNNSWGFKKSDTKWKSTDVLIQKLIDINTKGGNLLLNVGPLADGSWPEKSIQQLEEMGNWNAANAEAVYDAEFVAAPAQSWGKLAQTKDSNPASGALYAYVFDWPVDGKLKMEGLSFGKVEAFAEGQLLPITTVKDGVEVDLSAVIGDPYATVLKLTYSDMQMVEPAVDGYDFSGNELVLDARLASLKGNTVKLQGGSHIGYWTNPADTASWTLNVPAPGTFKVKALYSCAKNYAGSDAKLTVAGTTLTATVKATADWESFDVQELGQITLNDVGTTEVTLGFGPTRKKALFNLKALIFEPVEK